MLFWAGYSSWAFEKMFLGFFFLSLLSVFSGIFGSLTGLPLLLLKNKIYFSCLFQKLVSWVGFLLGFFSLLSKKVLSMGFIVFCAFWAGDSSWAFEQMFLGCFLLGLLSVFFSFFST